MLVNRAKYTMSKYLAPLFKNTIPVTIAKLKIHRCNNFQPYVIDESPRKGNDRRRFDDKRLANNEGGRWSVVEK